MRRAAGVQTKAYKEPVRKADIRSKPAPKPKPKPVLLPTSPEYERRLTMRASTAQKTSEIIKTMKQRDAEARRRKMKMKKHNKVRIYPCELVYFQFSSFDRVPSERREGGGTLPKRKKGGNLLREGTGDTS